MHRKCESGVGDASEDTRVKKMDAFENTASQFPKIAFPAGNNDFRTARNRCSLACKRYNEIAEEATVDERVAAFLT